MRLLNLELKNIGPFKSAELDFIGDGNVENPPVTIITGENGTGKTIILDAIRGVLLDDFSRNSLKRNIIRGNKYYSVELEVFDGDYFSIKNYYTYNGVKETKHTSHIDLINSLTKFNLFPKWIINYWTSKISDENLEIKSLVAPNPELFLEKALDGVQRNTEVIELITYFDYLRTSENIKEQEFGNLLFLVIKKIIKKSIINGEFKYVSRTNLMPIISQLGHEIELNDLSSGNLYLIQRMIGLLGQMYAVTQLHGLPIEDVCKIPGILLIDEAENHLHPKWQKTFLNDILEIFPNLQIIVTTHSPFIVSSVENARVYVCEPRTDCAEVVDRTSDYSNRPIEEVLVSPVFDTIPFNSKITKLLETRKQAIQQGNKALESDIEAQLKQLNPNHFAYLDIEQLLESISN